MLKNYNNKINVKKLFLTLFKSNLSIKYNDEKESFKRKVFHR